MPEPYRQPNPSSILRGHKTPVQTAVFIRGNDRLLTGDADGFVVAWDLTIMRPRAVWRAHDKPILGIQGWGHDKVLTHGRDHKLIVWKLDAESEAGLSTAPPLEQVPVSRPQPWMLHQLDVNTLNFCPFASCAGNPDDDKDSSDLMVAVPNALVSESVDIFHLPSQRRLHTVPSGDTHGMPMSLALFHRINLLTLISAFEDGSVAVAQLDLHTQVWTTTYRVQAHSQPILSLDVAPDRSHFFTSGADTVIAKHLVPTLEPAPVVDSSEPVEHVSRPTEVITQPVKVTNTKHTGQQSLRVRSDGRIFATAGWDSNVRVYSARSLKELAVLKWHQAGCYAICFANIEHLAREDGTDVTDETGVHARTDASELVEVEGYCMSQGTVGAHLHRADVSVRERRLHTAKNAHWVAAGGKDGKISLWHIY